MADRPMILPSTKDLENRYRPILTDDRVPIGFDLDDPPVRVGRYDNRDCAGHLFDAIMASREVFDAEGDVEREDFRLRLTCVRCGVIVTMDGALDPDRYRSSSQIEPSPIAAGGLRAQQTVSRGFGETWLVYVGADSVGAITWATGPRGREFYKGRFDAWPDGQTMQGPTPAAVLRKLARTPIESVS
jgi:hypothetical protein